MQILRQGHLGLDRLALETHTVRLFEHQAVQRQLQCVLVIRIGWHMAQGPGPRASKRRLVRMQRFRSPLPVDHVAEPVLVDEERVDLPGARS